MARLPRDPLLARIGYSFRDADLLEEALTHVSVSLPGGKSYQRLEYLGDRVLGLVISELLFETFPKATEGELSRRLADLVRKETCADIARLWGLGEHIRLGEGERRSGARKRDAILGDACEALLGAVFCDGGFEAARTLIRTHWQARMHQPVTAPKDPKTRLQELVQAKGLSVPRYVDIGRSGPDHAPQFEVAVMVDGHAEARGSGPSKRVAERAAAESWLAREGIET
ncbi:MAG: ribonuclease III [Rhizobiales bacterium]|nr:ribonuclease III [Hyphomicrobiales bacterium]